MFFLWIFEFFRYAYQKVQNRLKRKIGPYEHISQIFSSKYSFFSSYLLFSSFDVDQLKEDLALEVVASLPGILLRCFSTQPQQISIKRPVCIFAFGEYNSKQVNVSSITIFHALFQALKLRKEMLNAVNSYLFGIILTKCK